MQVVSTLAAVMGAIAAFLAIRTQDKNLHLSLTVSLVQQLTVAYHAEEMRARRNAAARSLLRLREVGGAAGAEAFLDVVPVLSFFAGMGVLVRRGALDEYFAWHQFFHEIDMYWHAARPLIERERRAGASLANPGFLEELALLHERLAAVGRGRFRRPGATSRTGPDAETVTRFLELEATLPTTSATGLRG